MNQAAAVRDLLIIARARDADYAAHLYRIGASDAVPETIEASLQLSEAVLGDVGVPVGPLRKAREPAGHAQGDGTRRRTPSVGTSAATRSIVGNSGRLGRDAARFSTRPHVRSRHVVDQSKVIERAFRRSLAIDQGRCRSPHRQILRPQTLPAALDDHEVGHPALPTSVSAAAAIHDGLCSQPGTANECPALASRTIAGGGAGASFPKGLCGKYRARRLLCRFRHRSVE